LSVAVVGFGVFTGLAVIARAVLASGGNGARAHTPEFTFWVGLVAATAVLFAFLFAHAAPVAARWRELGVPLWRPVLVYVLFAAVLVTFRWQAGSPVAHLRPTTAVAVSQALFVVGVVAAAPAVLGLWSNATRVRRAFDPADGRPRRADEVLRDLVDCRRGNTTCLAVLALVVSASVVNAGGQRRAFLATGTRPQDFPPEWVLLYGAIFTGISLLLYAPVFVAWRSACRRFVDDVCPLPADARPTEDWVASRTRLVQVLGADTSVAKTATAAFGILAPLATSVPAVVIPAVK
jgi:hypothetical protein